MEFISSFVTGFFGGSLGLITSPILFTLISHFFLLESANCNKNETWGFLSIVAILSSMIILFGVHNFEALINTYSLDYFPLVTRTSHLIILSYCLWFIYHLVLRKNFNAKAPSFLFLLLAIACAMQLAFVYFAFLGPFIGGLIWNWEFLQICLISGFIFGSVISFCILLYLTTLFKPFLLNNKPFKFLKVIVFVLIIFGTIGSLIRAEF
ncbi:MAG: hypothetical protein AAF487_02870 [Bacteroidota bacterium]